MIRVLPLAQNHTGRPPCPHDDGQPQRVAAPFLGIEIGRWEGIDCDRGGPDSQFPTSILNRATHPAHHLHHPQPQRPMWWLAKRRGGTAWPRLLVFLGAVLLMGKMGAQTEVSDWVLGRRCVRMAWLWKPGDRAEPSRAFGWLGSVCVRAPRPSTLCASDLTSPQTLPTIHDRRAGSG